MKNFKKHIKPIAVLVPLACMLAAALPMQTMADNTPTLTNKNTVTIGGNDELSVFNTKVDLNVYINGEFSGKLSDTYTFDTDIDIKAPETASGKNFSYCEAEGNILSYDKNIKISLTANTTLNAVYGKSVTAAAQSAPTVGFTSVNKDNDGNILFNAFTTATANETGIYYSTTVSTKNALISSGTKKPVIKDRNNCWTLTLKPETGKDYYYAMPYIIDGTTTYYGTVKKVRLSSLDFATSSTLDFGMDEEINFDDIDLSGIPTAKITKAPAGKSLTYNGKEQALITAGTAEGGTMQYSLDQYSGYSTELPTASENGTYTVWYKAAGDGSHLSTDPKAVTASISSAVVATKSYQTFTVHMDSYIYDGTAHEVEIIGETHGKIIYYYYNADTNEKLDEAPSEIGNYRVRIYTSGDASYYSRSQSAEYSITEPANSIDENGMANVENFKNNDIIPETEGKIFAGWFTDSTCTTPYTGDSGKAYAKFIDEKILTVKAQISSGTKADSEKTSIRFITSVDSLKYQNVGFKITYNGKTIDKQMTKVYSTLNANGKKVYPSVFSADSNYMEAYALNNIPNSAFGEKFTVTPYYTTQDGTIVDGETKTFTIANMIKN